MQKCGYVLEALFVVKGHIFGIAEDDVEVAGAEISSLRVRILFHGGCGVRVERATVLTDNVAIFKCKRGTSFEKIIRRAGLACRFI